MTVSGRRSGRLSVAGLIAMRPGSRTRLCHRLRTHPSGKGKRRSMAERDFIAHVKRSLVNLAVVALDRLEALVRNRLKRRQYRPDTLDGFIAGTGLTLGNPT
ncbi:transposase [Streptomyces sp. NPDC096311]|uniref:transposase n=1 Tax=Streptomyces sp. NPDC096311 TaxID=3366083 RepID=UPI0037FAA792